MFIDVYNDVLDKTHFQEVKHIVESAEFPWYIRYNRHVTDSTYHKDENIYQNNPLFSFTHLCSGWDNIKTDYYDMTHELAEKCRIKASLNDYVTERLRWRMQIRSQKGVLSKPHLDMKDFEPKDNLKVGIFYLHDSDGPTYIYNDEKRVIAEIESKSNRLLVMRGSLLHGGSKPKTHNFRIVLNINWVDKDYE